MRWTTAVLAAVMAGVTGLAPAASAADWRPWYCMPLKVPGAKSTGKPAVAARADSVVDVFAASPSGVYHRSWSASAGWLDHWAALGRPAGTTLTDWTGVSAVARTGNRISLVIAAGNQIWHRAYGSGGWGAWEPLGRPSVGFGNDPAISVRTDGTVDVWVRGEDSQVHHKYYAGGKWQPWSSIGGGVGGSPAAAGGPDGSVWVAALGVDFQFYYRSWKSGQWSAWRLLGAAPEGSFFGPGMTVRPDGTTDWFAVGGISGPLWHRWRLADATLGGWGSLQGADIQSSPSADARPGGALDVVLRKSDGTVCHRLWA